LDAMADDERFRHNKDRAENKTELIDAINSVLAGQTTSHWLNVLSAAGLPCGPVNTLPQALDHPQTQALGMFRDCERSGLKLTNLPLRFDRKRVDLSGDAPALGADTGDYVPENTAHQASLSKIGLRV